MMRRLYDVVMLKSRVCAGDGFEQIAQLKTSVPTTVALQMTRDRSPNFGCQDSRSLEV
jgi:hypothetical protein